MFLKRPATDTYWRLDEILRRKAVIILSLFFAFLEFNLNKEPRPSCWLSSNGVDLLWTVTCRNKESKCASCSTKRWRWRWALIVITAKGLSWICTPTSRSGSFLHHHVARLHLHNEWVLPFHYFCPSGNATPGSCFLCGVIVGSPWKDGGHRPEGGLCWGHWPSLRQVGWLRVQTNWPGFARPTRRGDRWEAWSRCRSKNI